MGTAGRDRQEPPGAVVRRLVRACDRAALATLAPDGQPHASLVLAACDADGSPLLLISDLAEHSRNLKGEPRLALLYDGTGGLDEPLTGTRASVEGTAEPTDEPRHRRRFLARHPSAEAYAGFADFRMVRVAVTGARIVAGFGRIARSGADEVLADCGAAAALLEAEEAVVAHMNEDHADALRLYATALLGLPEADWRMTGIDPEGVDLRAGGRTGRLDFPLPVHSPGEAREALVALARRARGGHA